VDDVATAVAASLEWECGAAAAPVTLAHPRRWTFAALLDALAARRGRRLRTFSVPGAVALAGLRLAEAAGLRLPFRSDSLLGLLHPPPAPDFELAARRGLDFRPFAEVSSAATPPGAPAHPR